MYKIVTWNTDLTQFLVNADNDDDAIDQAIKANEDVWQNTGGYPQEDREDSTHDRSTYKVEDVDIKMMMELFGRKDCGGLYRDAIVFWD